MGRSGFENTGRDKDFGMTRYVEDKHGMVIGSQNCFFYVDDTGEFREFNAILWARELTFDQVSTANVYVRSFAHQVIWDVEYRKVEQTRELDGKSIMTAHDVRVYVPTYFTRRWLDANAPGWGTPPVGETYKPGTLFFHRRGHAVAFRNAVSNVLKGRSYL